MAKQTLWDLPALGGERRVRRLTAAVVPLPITCTASPLRAEGLPLVRQGPEGHQVEVGGS